MANYYCKFCGQKTSSVSSLTKGKLSVEDLEIEFPRRMRETIQP